MTFRETASQGRTLLLLLCAGLAAGALYDLLSLPRRRCPPAAAAALDILWGMIISLLALLVPAASGEATLRFYGPLALLAGGGLYGGGIHTLFKSVRHQFQRIKKDGRPSE